MVFVHGWKHNAEFCDPNVACFREMLRTAALSDPLEREVVGVYVGWHGLSMSTLSNLSFFSRKRAAERVAQGQVRELFAKLLTLQTNAVSGEGNQHRMRLMFMGHSFGGLITYEALSPYLLAHAIGDKYNGQKTERFADLVLLVNPAFEALHYYPLHLASTPTQAKPQGDVHCPIFVSITSDNDDATKKWFPRGRRLAALFEDYKDPEEREMAVHTIGHWGKFKTHSLMSLTRGIDGPSKKVNGECQCQSWRVDDMGITSKNRVRGSEKSQDGLGRIYGNTILKPLTENTPANHWVVQTKPPIIDGHNDFFTEDVRNFILLLYNDIVAGARDSMCRR